MPFRRSPPPSRDAVQAFRLTAEIGRDFVSSFGSLPVRSPGRQWFGSRTLGRRHNRHCCNVPPEADLSPDGFESVPNAWSLDRCHDPAARSADQTNHRLERASGERRHVAFVNDPRVFAKKDDDYELPNGLTGCDGFGSLRRERVRVRGRQSARRPHAEVRRRLRRLPSDVRCVLPSLRIARERGEKGTCQVHASLRGLRRVLQNVRDVVRTAKRFLRHSGGLLRQMLRRLCSRLRENRR